VLADFQQGTVYKDRLLEAIACLGVIRSSEAALALALQLGLINAQAFREGTQGTASFDEDIVFAMVEALGRIGDRAAFEHLYHISYLNYSDHIQAAAKEAISRLRW
jgi:hypothetical protein